MTVSSVLQERSFEKEAITKSEGIMSIRLLPRPVVSAGCGENVHGLKMADRSNGIRGKMS
jgi:hypothetical protein